MTIRRLSVACQALLIALALQLPALAQEIKYGPSMGTRGQGVVLPDARNNFHLLKFVSPYDFGAACDGVTDDSTPLALWLAAGSATVGLQLPNAICAFATPLTKSSASGLYIAGGGPNQSTLLYTGAGATSDILNLGNASTVSAGLYLSNFRIRSTTQMSAGAGLHLQSVQDSLIENFVGGEDSATPNLWHGVWLDQVANVTYTYGQIFASGDAYRLNGGDNGQAEAALNGVFISRSGTGIHIGGRFGGFSCNNYTSLSANTNGIVIDHAIVAVKNREIFINDGCIVDSSTQDNIVVNDSLAGGSTLNLLGWNAGAVRYGVNIQNWGAGWIYQAVGPLFASGSDAIRLSDATATLVVAPGVIRNNGGYGVNCTAGGAVVAPGVEFAANAAGDVATSCLGARSQIRSGMQTIMPATSGWLFDNTANVISLANGAEMAIASGGGPVWITNDTNGEMAQVNFAGGISSLISSNFATIYAGSPGTSCGAVTSGKMCVYYNTSTGKYQISSNFGSTAAMIIMALVKQRNSG